MHRQLVCAARCELEPVILLAGSREQILTQICRKRPRGSVNAAAHASKSTLAADNRQTCSILRLRD